jgi:hypothetical protein
MKAWRQQGSLDLNKPTHLPAPLPVALSRLQLAGASASALLVARLRSVPSVPLASLSRALSLHPSLPHPPRMRTVHSGSVYTLKIKRKIMWSVLFSSQLCESWFEVRFVYIWHLSIFLSSSVYLSICLSLCLSYVCRYVCL